MTVTPAIEWINGNNTSKDPALHNSSYVILPGHKSPEQSGESFYFLNHSVKNLKK